MDLRVKSSALRDYINYALPFPVAAPLSVDKTSDCGKKAGSGFVTV